MGTPNKIIAIITKMQSNHKHNDNSTSNKDVPLNHGLNLRYYRFHCTRGNNPKTHFQTTQEGDKEQF